MRIYCTGENIINHGFEIQSVIQEMCNKYKVKQGNYKNCVYLAYKINLCTKMCKIVVRGQTVFNLKKLTNLSNKYKYFDEPF